MRAIQHLVSNLSLDGVQPCLRCGEVLTDYRNTMVPVETPALGGFPPGPVYRLGNMTTVIEPEEGSQSCEHVCCEHAAAKERALEQTDALLQQWLEMHFAWSGHHCMICQRMGEHTAFCLKGKIENVLVAVRSALGMSP